MKQDISRDENAYLPGSPVDEGKRPYSSAWNFLLTFIRLVE